MADRFPTSLKKFRRCFAGRWRFLTSFRFFRGVKDGRYSLSVSNGHLNLDSGFDVDGGDLLDDLAGGVEVDDALVDAQLELVPGLGALSARGLTGGDPQGLGGHPHGALHLEVLLLGAPDELGAHLLERGDVPGGEGDPDPVDLLLLFHSLAILVRHFLCRDNELCHQR